MVNNHNIEAITINDAEWLAPAIDAYLEGNFEGDLIGDEPGLLASFDLDGYFNFRRVWEINDEALLFVDLFEDAAEGRVFGKEYRLAG